jgi:hypothetical protein
MMKHPLILLTIVLLLAKSDITSQSLTSSVFALTGAYSKTPTGASFSWTIGEPVVDPIRSEILWLTQGFQQPDLKLDTRFVDPSLTYKMEVFPNPTTSNLIMQSDYPGRILFRLTDIGGKLLMEEWWTNNYQINVAALSQGVYPIYFLFNDKVARTELLSKQ